MMRFTRAALLCACFMSTMDLFSPVGCCSEPLDLETLLKSESAGESVNRRVLNTMAPADPFSAWQAGMVKQSDQWKFYDQLATGKKESEYLAKREELKGSPQKHRILAKWCVLHDLPGRARAHFYGVLSSASNNLEAREYLGHLYVGDSWVDRSDLEVAQHGMRKTLESFDDWVPKIKSIVIDLHSGRSKVMTKAFEALDRIDSEAALPSLEVFASNVDDDLAKPLIRKIASVRSRDSCLALVRIALAHPSASIRSITAEAIRKYPQSHYVPELLSMLAGETQVDNRLVMQPNGTVGLETLLHNELQDKKQVQRAQKLVNVVSVFSSSHSSRIYNTAHSDILMWSKRMNIPKNAPVSLGSKSDRSTEIVQSSFQSTYVPTVVFQNVSDNLNEGAKQQQRAVTKSNRDLKENTNRICTLLRATTKEEIEDSPTLWWSWWNEYNERYQSEKPTAYGYSSQQERIVVASRTLRGEIVSTERDLGPKLVQYSCLVPGTPVHTSSGLVPIEKIQIGDLVLSQDIETAELTLKPVILTTIRPPKSTIKIGTSTGTMEATGGHLWWASGQGWVKTRDLKPGMTLRTVTGTSTIVSLEFNPILQQTHNLVVDGFHTYFVGEERVLSYDNSLAKPTLRQLPGYGQTIDISLGQ